MSEPEVLRVVKGDPTPEELAALVTALSSLAADFSVRQKAPSGLSAWGAYWHKLRQPVHPSADGWRKSALPR